MGVYNILMTNTYSGSIRNSTNTSFSQTLASPCVIPQNAANVYASIKQSAIPNVLYNISAAKGNNIFYITNDQALPQKYTITLPDGSYQSIDSVNSYLGNFLLSNGFSSTAIQFLENTATQKLILQVKTGYGVKIPTAFSTISGYTANYTVFNSGATDLFYEAPNKAMFNEVVSFTIFVSGINSSFYNGQTTNMMCNVPIDAPVGSLINHQPNNPIKIPCDNLAGSSISNFTVTIKDQNGHDIELSSSESWYVVLTIEWE